MHLAFRLTRRLYWKGQLILMFRVLTEGNHVVIAVIICNDNDITVIPVELSCISEQDWPTVRDAVKNWNTNLISDEDKALIGLDA
jgi:hypothetical protein